MESDENHNNIASPASSGGGSPSTHRWTPTKEQISMLENMYNQGIKTPTAEQIQEITTRLKVYGHIEGKNVFYWFQNHKARQRQKQKQDHFASFNRFLQHTPPFLPPPPPPNVVCSPYYLPPSDLGFYPQCPKLLLPPLVKKRTQIPEMFRKPSHNHAGELSGVNECMPQMGTTTPANQETLTLFPMHPTGILNEKTAASSASNSSENSIATTPSSSSDTTCLNEQEAVAAEHHFIDFFNGNGTSFGQSH